MRIKFVYLGRDGRKFEVEAEKTETTIAWITIRDLSNKEVMLSDLPTADRDAIENRILS